jgi:hypothetical protein
MGNGGDIVTVTTKTCEIRARTIRKLDRKRSAKKKAARTGFAPTPALEREPVFSQPRQTRGSIRDTSDFQFICADDGARVVFRWRIIMLSIHAPSSALRWLTQSTIRDRTALMPALGSAAKKYTGSLAEREPKTRSAESQFPAASIRPLKNFP